MIISHYKYFDRVEWCFLEIEIFANSLIEAQAEFDNYLKIKHRYMSEKEYQENLLSGYFKIKMDRFEEVKLPSIKTVRKYD